MNMWKGAYYVTSILMVTMKYLSNQTAQLIACNRRIPLLVANIATCNSTTDGSKNNIVHARHGEVI